MSSEREMLTWKTEGTAIKSMCKIQQKLINYGHQTDAGYVPALLKQEYVQTASDCLSLPVQLVLSDREKYNAECRSGQ